MTLQEANALAIVDIPTATVQEIVPLGRKNHALPGNGLDPSDRDGPGNAAKINIGTWPVHGLYQPDAIASFKVGPELLLVTANEGDSRSCDDFPGFNEEVRVGSSAYRLDPTAFPNATALKANAALGRLTVTNASGDTDGDGDFDRIEVFGARSVSIWSPAGSARGSTRSWHWSASAASWRSTSRTRARRRSPATRTHGRPARLPAAISAPKA